MNSHHDFEKEIRRLYDTEPSPGLRQRLLRIPQQHPRRKSAGTHLARWYVALPAAAAAGLIGLIWLQPQQPAPGPDPVAVAAVQDFVTAMTYLQRSTAYANREMQGQLGTELVNAVALSRASVRNLNSDIDNGG
jgi:hypothetical protein